MHEEQEKPEILFIAGMNWFNPRDNAPEFVKGRISIEPKRLIAFMEANKQYMSEKGYFSVDVKKSRKGEIYLSLDCWKPTPKN